MPKLHFCAQYSSEYEALKLGLPTSSNFHALFTKPSKKFPKGQPSTQWKHLAHHLIAERLLKRPVETFTSYHMERGLEMEPEAVAWYEWETGVETQLIGFITTDDGKAGCSPDRLIGEDGLLEIKCPTPTGQVDYLLDPDAAHKHWPQLQGQLLVSGRRWVDLLAWHRHLQRRVVRVERDEEYIGQLDWQLRLLNQYIDGVMSRLWWISEQGPPPQADRPEGAPVDSPPAVDDAFGVSHA
jgi:hypothetical protein